jgi:hypothetical protein
MEPLLFIDVVLVGVELAGLTPHARSGHALVTSAFVGSGVLYATGGGHGPGVSRLAAAGLGGAAALGAVQVMGWLFPYSPMLF